MLVWMIFRQLQCNFTGAVTPHPKVVSLVTGPWRRRPIEGGVLNQAVEETLCVPLLAIMLALVSHSFRASIRGKVLPKNLVTDFRVDASSLPLQQESADPSPAGLETPRKAARHSVP